MKKIAIGAWAYLAGPYLAKSIPWEEVVATLQELGFDGIELGAQAPHPNPRGMPDAERRDICREGLQSAGLEWSGLVADLRDEHLIDTEDTRPYLFRFREHLRFCIDLKIPRLALTTLQTPDVLARVDYDSARRRVGDTWRRCAAEAEECGIQLLWEFAANRAFNKPTDVFRILETVAHDNFGILFDTCHAHMIAVQGVLQSGSSETLSGGVAEFARKLRGTLHHLHLMDSNGVMDQEQTPTRCVIGEGEIGFEALFLELAKHDLGHAWWTVDLGRQPDLWPSTEACKAAVDHFNKGYG